MGMAKVSLSLPTRVLEDAEKRLARPNESRSALMARLLEDALRQLDEREAEERYIRGYQEQPETEDERAANMALARALLRGRRAG
jgi:metal-responsive CopG/Arc/MetJ family transcriptional regulator